MGKERKEEFTVADNAYPHELDRDICLAGGVETS